MNEDLDRKIQSLESKSEDELFDIVGVFAVAQEKSVEGLAMNKGLSSKQIKDAAKEYFEKIKPVIKDAICGKDGLAHYADQASVKDVVTILLPALGYSTIGIVPTAIIAVSVIIVRSGIREYCKGYPS
jgi:hypothetical protein